jgi:L-histidine N-alpha-methyltransferase
MHVTAVMSHDDRFLLGVDLAAGSGKSAERIEAAYNDARGITAQFSLNLLSVLNDSFGSDFDLDGFRHRSEYNEELSRIETSLVSRRAQTVCFPDEEPIVIAQGEAIRSEISCKYDRPTVERLFSGAGLEVDRWMTDPDELYALVLGRLSDS